MPKWHKRRTWDLPSNLEELCKCEGEGTRCLTVVILVMQSMFLESILLLMMCTVSFAMFGGWKGGSRIDQCAVLVGKHFTPRRNACKSTVRTLGFHDGQG